MITNSFNVWYNQDTNNHVSSNEMLGRKPPSLPERTITARETLEKCVLIRFYKIPFESTTGFSVNE